MCLSPLWPYISRHGPPSPRCVGFCWAPSSLWPVSKLVAAGWGSTIFLRFHMSDRALTERQSEAIAAESTEKKNTASRKINSRGKTRRRRLSIIQYSNVSPPSVVVVVTKAAGIQFPTDADGIHSLRLTANQSWQLVPSVLLPSRHLNVDVN